MGFIKKNTGSKVKLSKALEMRKARKMPIGTVVYRRDGAHRKIGENKWIPLPKKELVMHRKIYNDVSIAFKTVKDRDYNLSTAEGFRKLHGDIYKALQKKFSSSEIVSLKRFASIMVSDKFKTGMDQWDAVSDAIIKRKEKGVKKVISKKIKIKVKDQLGNVEEVELDRNDPLAQMYIKKQEKKRKLKQEVLSKLKKLKELNIKTMEDIDKHIKKGESRYSTLKRLVGESTANIIMRNLEVRSYEGVKNAKRK